MCLAANGTHAHRGDPDRRKGVHPKVQEVVTRPKVFDSRDLRIPARRKQSKQSKEEGGSSSGSRLPRALDWQKVLVVRS